MKRISLFLCLIALFLTGCSGETKVKDSAPKVEDYTWQMISIQSMEAEGQFVAIGPDREEVAEEVPELQLICAAGDGALSLSDETNGESYTGTYKLVEAEQQTATYEVTVDGKEGMAVVSFTTYHDDSKEPTFIMSLGGYTINFLGALE